MDKFAKLTTLSKDMVLEAESEKDCQPLVRGKALPRTTGWHSDSLSASRTISLESVVSLANLSTLRY